MSVGLMMRSKERDFNERKIEIYTHKKERKQNKKPKTNEKYAWHKNISNQY